MPLYRGSRRLVMSRRVVAAAGNSPFSKAFTANAFDNTPQTQYTFAAQSLGTYDSKRLLAVVFGERNAGGTQLASSVTIGGVTCSSGTTAIDAVLAGGCEIWYTPILGSVPGTSGDVVINVGGGGNSRCGMALYSIISPSSSTPTFTASSNSGTPASSGSQTMPAGGVVIGGLFDTGGWPVTPTATPSGFNNLDANQQISGSQGFCSFSSAVGGLSGSQTLTIDNVGTSTPVAVFAGWGP